jgi:uncharacterized Zn-binding protein involved in type VI secretion
MEDKDCCHTCSGPTIAGSGDTFINNKPAIRVGAPGRHAACCGPNTYRTAAGSPDVFINNIAAVRIKDRTAHCGGIGMMIEGSGDTFYD